MAAITPYEFPPPGGTAFFRNGEKWLTHGANYNSMPNGTYYFARMMQLRGGAYTIKIMVDDAATMWLGVDFAASSMYLSVTLGDGETAFDIHLQPGLQRMDMIVQNLGSGPCGFVMSLWQDGKLIYASAASGWLVDTFPIPDEGVPPAGDARRLMPVYSVLPNWENGVLERIAFMTDVLESETGAEQRRALRVHPRREFEAGFLRKGPNRAMIDSFLTGVGQDLLLVPLWHEAITMKEGIEVGASGVLLETDDTAEREYREDDLVFVNGGDPNVFDILQIAVVEDNRFTWATLPERSWPPGTRIYPLRTARITETTPMENITEDVATAQIRFSLEEPYVLDASWGPLINGQPFFYFRPNRSTTLTANINRLTNVQDNSVGVPSITDISESSAVTTSMSFAHFGRTRVYEWRRFLMAAMGRARGFYCASFADDLVPLYPVIDEGIYLVTKPMGAGRFFTRIQSARSYIGITLYGEDRPSIVRKIVAVEKQFTDQFGLDVDYQTNFWYDRFQLDTALPELQASQVLRISFISQARFDQDNFELSHRTNISKAIRSSAAVRMLGQRRMADNTQPEYPTFPPIEKEPSGTITLQPATYSDSGAQLTEVMFTLRSDGKIELAYKSNGQISTPGTWLIPTSEANLYEVHVSQTGGNGTLRLGALNVWQRTSTTRSWALRAEATVEDIELSATLIFEFRDISTSTIRYSVMITLQAEADIPRGAEVVTAGGEDVTVDGATVTVTFVGAT